MALVPCPSCAARCRAGGGGGGGAGAGCGLEGRGGEEGEVACGGPRDDRLGEGVFAELFGGGGELDEVVGGGAGGGEDVHDGGLAAGDGAGLVHDDGGDALG